MTFMNPIPGDTSYHVQRHGHPLVHALLAWSRTLSRYEPGPDAIATADAAAASGGEILNLVARAGATQDIINDLQGSMHQVLTNMARLVTRASQGGAPGGGGADGCGLPEEMRDDPIDWYEPDPNRFYVLDKRSGAELAAVLDDLRCVERYLKRGARAPTRQLFIGGPGTGKTTGALWIGAQLNKPVALLRIDAAVISTVGGIAKRVRRAFEMAQEREAILLIDEFEAIAVPRGNQSANVGQWSRETTAALQQLLDSLPPEQVVIAATNLVDAIDPAVRRRMRDHVYFYPPDREARASMLGKWWATAPHDGAAKRVLLDRTEGLSGDALERMAEHANRAAARRDERAPVTVEDVEAAFASVVATMVVTGEVTAETLTVMAGSVKPSEAA